MIGSIPFPSIPTCLMTLKSFSLCQSQTSILDFFVQTFNNSDNIFLCVTSTSLTGIILETLFLEDDTHPPWQTRPRPSAPASFVTRVSRGPSVSGSLQHAGPSAVLSDALAPDSHTLFLRPERSHAAGKPLCLFLGRDEVSLFPESYPEPGSGKVGLCHTYPLLLPHQQHFWDLAILLGLRTAHTLGKARCTLLMFVGPQGLVGTPAGWYTLE